jgi:hypothetical protein
VGAINQLNVSGLGSDVPLATGVEGESSPPRFVLGAPRPNPTPAGSMFDLSLPQGDRGRLEVYDVQGRLRGTRILESLGAGRTAVRWDPGLPSGRYLVRIVFHGRAQGSTSWTVVR